MEYGDVDLLIVFTFDSSDAQQEDLVRSTLAQLIDRFRQDHEIELEPVAASPGDLRTGPLLFLLADGYLKANSVVQYLVKNESAVIYGNSRLLDAIPQIGQARDRISVVAGYGPSF